MTFADAPFRAAELFPPLDLHVEERTDGSTIITCGKLDPPPPNIPSVLRSQAERRGERSFLAERGPDGEWQHHSYVEVADTADRIAGWFVANGYGPGRPLLIVTGNSVAHALIMFGAIAAGVPVCPVSEQYALAGGAFDRLQHVVNVVAPAVVFAERVAPVRNALHTTGLTSRAQVICLDPHELAGSVDLQDVLTHDPLPDAAERAAALHPDTPAKYMLTSGSTGLPKVVVQTNGNWCAIMTGALQNLAEVSGWGERTLDWMPWSHVAGISVVMGVLFAGGSHYLDEGRPTPDRFPATLRNIAEVQPRFFANVPYAFGLLCDAMEADDDLRDRFFEAAQLCLYGGAGLPQPVYDRFQQMAVDSVGERIMFTTGYGMTETTAGVMAMTWPTELVGVGLPAPGVVAKLIPLPNPDGSVSDRFEIRFGGACVMPGYLNNPEANARSFDEDGFYRTGDTLRWIDRAQPELGLEFAGRLAEEFKLATGTWVQGGRLRAEIIAACNPLVVDAVVCGQNRSEIGLLLWVNPAGVRSALNITGTPDELANDPRVLAALAAAIGARQHAGTPSSDRIGRIAVLAAPPDPAAGELSDKGSVNQALALINRASDVARLYDGGPGVIVFDVG